MQWTYSVPQCAPPGEPCMAPMVKTQTGVHYIYFASRKELVPLPSCLLSTTSMWPCQHSSMPCINTSGRVALVKGTDHDIGSKFERKLSSFAPELSTVQATSTHRLLWIEL